jgi:hypothetical protein
MTPRLARNLRTFQSATAAPRRTRFVVVRWDGVELGEAPTREQAEETARVASQGQRPDFVRVVAPGVSRE